MENSVAVCGEPVESMPHVSHARVFARDSQLTTDPRPQFAPQWSPDGRQIAFTASERGNRELRVILAEGGRFGRSHPIRPRSSGRVGRQMAAKSPSSLGGPATPTSGFSGPRVANLGNSLWTPPTISYPSGHQMVCRSCSRRRGEEVPSVSGGYREQVEMPNPSAKDRDSGDGSRRTARCFTSQPRGRALATSGPSHSMTAVNIRSPILKGAAGILRSVSV